MSKKVLITGAGGFIGSHLTELLVHRGYEVRALIHYNSSGSWGWLEEVLEQSKAQRPERTKLGVRYRNLNEGGNLEVVMGDIQDPFCVGAAVDGCEVVFHLAALIGIPYSYVAPASYISTNVVGTLNVLEACRSYGVSRLIHTSTSEVYGTAQYTPIDEEHPLVGQSPYAASKVGADQLALSYYRSFGLPVSVIRPFNTFGPRQSARAVIPTIISQAFSGREVIWLGSLSPIRDLNYVKDTAAGFLAVAESEHSVGRVTNIGRGEGISIGELAKLILSTCDSSSRVEIDTERIRPESSEVFELLCNNTWACTFLGWQPRYSLEQGLKETVDWMRTHLHCYKSAIYNI